MKRFSLIVLAAGLFAQPAGLSAQLYYNGIPDDQEYLRFISGSGVNGGYGVQVGPYVGSFLESPTTPAFNIYCVDFNHHAKSQTVNVTALTSGGALTNTRLGDYETYRKAAYLSSLFHDPAHAGSWGAIHAAIWSATGGTLPAGAIAGTYATMPVPVDFSTAGWYILSPDPLTSLNQQGRDISGQEFLMRVHSVPEPATFLLMASGLLLLAAFSRKRLSALAREDV